MESYFFWIYTIEIANESEETVQLKSRVWRITDGHDKIVLVKSVSSPADVHIAMAEGQRLPIMMGATGRVLAPHLGLSTR